MWAPSMKSNKCFPYLEMYETVALNTNIVAHKSIIRYSKLLCECNLFGK